MKIKRMLFISILVVLGGLYSCKEDYTPVDNVIYFAEAQKAISGKVTVDDMGGKAKVTVRLAKSVDSNTEVVVSEEAVALNVYNEKFGTEYKLLPKDFYSLSTNGETTKGSMLTTTIEAGHIAADFINIQINPFDGTLSESAKYAIPLVIKSVKGSVDMLKSSSVYIVLIDRVVITNVCYLDGTNFMSYTSPMPVELENWTFEWMVKMNAFNRNNVSLWQMATPPDDRNGPMVYTRFGDVLTPQNKLQVNVSQVTKHNSITEFTPNKWYHMAITYNGTNVKLYVNGVLELDVPHAKAGQKFILTKLYFSNPSKSQYRLNGYCSELRMWSVARTGPQITNNMYGVDPASDGLEVYWKCNEGEGKLIKDHSGNGRDVTLPTVPKWVSGQRFPAE